MLRLAMPRLSLARKLTLAFLLVAVTAVLLVAVFIRLTNASQFNQLVLSQARSDFETTLVTYYENNGSWDGVLAYVVHNRLVVTPPATLQPGNNTGTGRGFGGGGPNGGEHGPMFGLVDAQGLVVIPLMPGFPVGAHVTAAQLSSGTPVTVNGQVVGTILTPPSPPGLSPEQTAYLQRTDLALLLASGGGLVVAVLVGLLLARTFTRPLLALTQATHRMAEGALGQQVAVRSSDEIGELATAFNKMSHELERAVQVRRQMTADIAHELRTPLTVIAGYIESMADGVLAATPERLAVIYSEIEHLQRLVGDLRTLTQADAGELTLHRQPLAPEELVQRAYAAFEHQAQQAQVALEVRADAAAPLVAVDEIRLAQVLSNLVSNALRYTPAGGRIVLGAHAQDGGVDLTVSDTGPGIAPADLPLVFNRFYRADKSRSEDGASGLGLAIARALVEAHGGTIEAHSQPGHGATMRIHLPAISQ